MMPTLKLELSEIRRRQKSSATSQTWTQPHLNGKLTTYVCWPLCPQWPLEAVRSESVEPRQFIADHTLAKADVIRTMHERAELCQDPQTEFALIRESPSCECTATPSFK